MPLLIQVKNLSKTFTIREHRIDTLREYVYNFIKRQDSKKTIHALTDINFEVKKGEVLGIIGHNGSGKSTLLRCLIGSLEPDPGSEIIINGKMMKLTLGTGFDPNISAKENIYLNGSILGLSFKKIGSLMDSIIEYAELEEFVDTPIKFYSAGMRSRLAFAIAIHSEADIFLFDEFFGGVGDVGFQKKSNEAFNKTFIDNKTVLLVSHNLNLIKQVCDRAIILSKGIQSGPDNVEKIITNYLSLFDSKAKSNEVSNIEQEIYPGAMNRNEYLKLRSSLKGSIHYTNFNIDKITRYGESNKYQLIGYAIDNRSKSACNSVIIRVDEKLFYLTKCDQPRPDLNRTFPYLKDETPGFTIDVYSNLDEPSMRLDLILNDKTTIFTPLKTWTSTRL